MNNPLISIIVPVYKVERYLPRCIESILGQTYTNFELILVDDGTPDRSGIICDRYAEKDSRIRVIHKENGGVSSARNAGIEIAQGEWITFIDSDDWVTCNYLEVLLQPISEYDCDLTLGALEWRYIQISKSEHAPQLLVFNEMEDVEVLKAINRTEFYGPCLKLFSKHIIDQNDLRFEEGVKIAEDAIFVSKYLKNTNTVYSTGKVVYYYNCLNSLSATNKPYYSRILNNWSLQYIEAYDEMLESFNIKEPFKSSATLSKAVEVCRSNIKSVISVLDEEDAKKEICVLLKYYDSFIFAGHASAECIENTELQIFLDYLRRRDIDAIYNSLKTPKKRKYFKRLIKKIARPLLERFRDGLIKYKW